jgi:streptomycin 6-kinase
MVCDAAEGLPVSPALRRTLDELGDPAGRWLERVPSLLAELSVAWDLEVGCPVEHGGCASIILPVASDHGVAAVLKLSVPHEEARHEVAALRGWRGEGAVTLLRASEDGLALLLERCDPGQDLWTFPADGQLDVMADLLPRLWIAAPDTTLPDLSDTAARWKRQLHGKAAALGVPAAIADRAQRWITELAADDPRRLLHGDLHPGNVLAAQREPWLAIDPKPCIGDPAFDLAQLLLNWLRAEIVASKGSVDAVRSRALTLAARLSLDPERVLRWAVIKAIGWSFGRDETIVLDQVARSV